MDATCRCFHDAVPLRHSEQRWLRVGDFQHSWQSVLSETGVASTMFCDSTTPHRYLVDPASTANAFASDNLRLRHDNCSRRKRTRVYVGGPITSRMYGWLIKTAAS